MPPSRFRLRRLAAASLTLFACLVSSTGPAARGSESPSAQAQQNNVVSSLERYAQGEFDEGVKQLLGSKTVRAVMGDFKKRADAWITAAPEAQRAQRTYVVGAITVELLAATFEQHQDEYRQARYEIEWACERLRKLPPSDVERWFDMAVIALAQGAGDHARIDGHPNGDKHADHPLDRFPGDTRFMMAIATVHPEAQQITTWPLSPAMIVRPPSNGFTENETMAAEGMSWTLQALSELFDDAAVGPEARLRSGVLRFLRQDISVARTDLEAAERAQDPAVRQLAHLMLGAIADRDGDAAEALRHYTLGYEAMRPTATASIALAGRLFRSGAVDDAAMVLRTFNTASDVPDPWEMYGQRDFKSFPAIRQELRRSVYEAMGKKLPAESAPTVAGPAVLKFSGRVPASTATVSVLVQVDGKPAPDLTAADFDLTDNGVAQSITSAGLEGKALDVTVVTQEFTRSRSGKYETLDAEISSVAAALTPADRLTVMYIGRDPRPFTPPGTRDLLRESSLEERCIPVYDTLARALIEPAQGGRQRVVLLISPREGKGGFSTTAPVVEIARRSNARLYITNLAPERHTGPIAKAVCPYVSMDFSKDRQDYLRSGVVRDTKQFRLVNIAESTAGREIRPAALRERAHGPLQDAIDESRATYVLRYTPKGVPDNGWHPIAVKVTKPGRYDVRARPGYER